MVPRVNTPVEGPDLHSLSLKKNLDGDTEFPFVSHPERIRTVKLDNALVRIGKDSLQTKNQLQTLGNNLCIA